jgi:hypothetical protein
LFFHFLRVAVPIPDLGEEDGGEASLADFVHLMPAWVHIDFIEDGLGLV